MALFILVGGIPTPLKNMKVSWDDYSQYMETHKIHVPNHQPEWVVYGLVTTCLWLMGLFPLNPPAVDSPKRRRTSSMSLLFVFVIVGKPLRCLRWCVWHR